MSSRSGKTGNYSLSSLHHGEGSHPHVGTLYPILPLPQDVLHAEQIHQVETCAKRRAGVRLERRIGSQQRQPAPPALGRAVGGFRQRELFKDVPGSKRINDTKYREAQLPSPSPSLAKGAGETQTRGFQDGVCAVNVPRHHRAPGTWRVSWLGLWCRELGVR